MRLLRAVRHLLAPDWFVLRRFPRATLDRVQQAVADSERLHRGEIRFAVEAGLAPLDLLRSVSARDRAVAAFARLGVWDTEENCGVLVYVQMFDRRIEIVADRGIAARVPQAEWEAVCRGMEAAFRDDRYEQGALDAIARVTHLLAQHFPPRADNPNELPDRPAVL